LSDSAHARMDHRSDPYDDVPYTSYPYPRSHPERLATVASLFGMRPASLDSCRVLELGCASGGNLLPLAERFPSSEFVGIDRSARQIEAGRELAAEADLRNVELVHADLVDLDASLGSFDYVICHGVFSWVTRSVQTKILAILREHLRPQGIAYVSYNVYPGWHMRTTVRDMMRYHVRNVEAPERRIAEARAFIELLCQHVSPTASAYGMALHEELRLVRALDGDYLFHEHLEAENHPVYFHDFAQRVQEQRLRYVGEAEIHTMLLMGHSHDLAQTLEAHAHDIISMEQYMDFVRSRRFRSSILCQSEVELHRDLTPALIEHCQFEFEPSEDGQPERDPNAIEEFVTAQGVRIHAHRPLTKAAIFVLQRAWPRALDLDALLREVAELDPSIAPSTPEAARDTLLADLLALAFGGGVGLRTWSPSIATNVPLRPLVGRLARLQAKRGDGVTNLRHRHVKLSRSERHLLLRLDGRHDREQLLAEMTELVVDGTLDLARDGVPLRDRDHIREPLDQVLTQMLSNLARRALLS